MSQQKFDKILDAASYNDFARGYDKYIHRLSAPLAEHICRLANVRPGTKLLDVGTGSGVAARTAARLAAPGGEVLGVDLSDGMISTAENSVAGWSDTRPQFRVMDAEALDLPDAAFDAVTSLCAVRHFPDIARGLTEMNRVIKPGGTLVVSFGYARPITPIHLGLHVAGRVIDKILNPVRPQFVGPVYLTGLAKNLLPAPEQVIATDWGNHGNPRANLKRYVIAAGFDNVEASWWGHEVIFDSVDEFWEAQTSIVTEVRKRLAAAPPEDVDKVKQLFFKKAGDVVRRGGRLVYPYGAFFVRGLKP